MADHTAYPDWVDCRALRAAEASAGEWGRTAGLTAKPGAGTGAPAWQSALRLIDPEPEVDHAALKAQAEAEAAAQALAAAQAKAEAEAEHKARAAAEAQARAKAEAEAAAKAQAEERAKEQARREAEAAAQRKAEAEAAAAAAAKAEREDRARRAAEAQAQAEAEAKAQAEEQARLAAQAAAQAAAEEQARREAAAAAAKAAAKAKAEAQREARERAEAKARAAAEAKAKAKAEAEEQARLAAAAKAAAEEQERSKAKAKAAAEANAKALAEAEARAKAEAEERARLAAEAAATETAAAEAAAAEAAKIAEAAAAARARIDLGKSFRRLIRETGPISLAHYMAESNARYYASRDPLGDQGDFVTAPEISQMFGELVGLWLADLWVRMGARKHIHYVELGPGRGTLAKDALSTAARYDFAPQVHFVETSPTLRALQRETFPGCHHHHDLSTLPDDAPLLIVANEFFDALPIHQLVRSADGWFERMVGLDGDAFAYTAGRERMDHMVPQSWVRAAQGAMIETSPAAVAVMSEIAGRLTQQGGAALIIDYGHRELRAGSTLQALKAHQKVDVFAHPGEADITAHVDFELLEQVAQTSGADVMGVQTQGEWLRQMGIDTRLEALQRRNPREAEKLRRQRDRLVEPGQMGTLFKVLGLCGRRWPFGVGFE